MNTESSQNWNKKLEDLEKEINNSNFNSQNVVNKVRAWFLSLPPTARVIVTIVALIFTLSLLKTVFSLLQLVISVAILGIIFYFIVNFFKG
jgi:hypothetical protein